MFMWSFGALPKARPRDPGWRPSSKPGSGAWSAEKRTALRAPCRRPGGLDKVPGSL